MTTFKDLVFEHDEMGEHAFELYPNHYGISVIRGPYSYGGDKGLYEIAVLRSEVDILKAALRNKLARHEISLIKKGQDINSIID